MEQAKKHIEVTFNTKQRFDKLQADLKFIGVMKTKSELIDMLMDIYKEYKKVTKK